MTKILRGAGKSVYNLFLFLFSLTCIFPIIWIVYSSFKSNNEFMLNVMALPQHISFKNYYTAFVEGRMYVNFIASALNTCVAVSAVIFLAFITGYVLARYRFKGRNQIYTLFLVGMLTPVYALIVPLFIQMKTLGMIDNVYTLIVPYIAIRLPIAIFLIESFVRTLPVELDEAAYIDGASVWSTLWKIIFPVCRPVLATVLILTFLDTWNEFPFALVLVTQDAFRTVPVALTNFYGQYTTDYTALMAALVLSILPVIVVYLLFYKKIIQGMTAGAVKG
jgi:ABC-type sugar transport system, permease component